MAQKNFDIDDRLAEQFKTFCKSRGLSMSYAAGASLLWFMNASPDEREKATLLYDRYVTEHIEQGDHSHAGSGRSPRRGSSRRRSGGADLEPETTGQPSGPPQPSAASHHLQSDPSLDPPGEHPPG
jgi:hypothetical protein